MMALIAALLMGIAESYRGATAGVPRIIEKFVLGALALGALGAWELLHDWRFALAYLLAFSAGCSVSWGAVISGSLSRTPDDVFQAHIDFKRDRGDWYLVGPFRKSAMRGLFARSLVWGVLASAPLFAFGHNDLGLAMLAVYSVAMPAAVRFFHLVEGSRFDMAIGRLCMALVGKNKPWARHEVYRGWIAGQLLLMCRACRDIELTATFGWLFHFWR